MIEENLVRNLVSEKLDGTDLFLIDISVKPGNKIKILIDAIKGLSVDDCVTVSRHVESSLDREAEDFELQVSSPGADSPFKVLDQYKKYEGRNIEVITLDDKIIEGKLISAEESEFVMEAILPSKANKKIKAKENLKFNYNQVKQTKATISFK